MQPQSASQPLSAPGYTKPGPSLLVSIIVMVVGALIAVPSAVKAFVPIVRSFTTNPQQTPVDMVKHLSHGTYVVYQRAGSVYAVTETDVSVTDRATGEPVPVHLPSDSETVTVNGVSYDSQVAFDTPHSGDYEVRVASPGDNNVDVIVTRSLADTVKAVLGWFALMGLGGLTFIAGVVLLIVGATRRGRAKRMAYAYAASGYAGYPQYTPTPSPTPIPSQSIPAGWYPDPTPPAGSPPTQKRWWDGSAWTEHTQP
jgi:hypothetical protein